MNRARAKALSWLLGLVLTVLPSRGAFANLCLTREGDIHPGSPTVDASEAFSVSTARVSVGRPCTIQVYALADAHPEALTPDRIVISASGSEIAFTNSPIERILIDRPCGCPLEPAMICPVAYLRYILTPVAPLPASA